MFTFLTKPNNMKNINFRKIKPVFYGCHEMHSFETRRVVPVSRTLNCTSRSSLKIITTITTTRVTAFLFSLNWLIKEKAYRGIERQSVPTININRVLFTRALLFLCCCLWKLHEWKRMEDYKAFFFFIISFVFHLCLIQTKHFAGFWDSSST